MARFSFFIIDLQSSTVSFSFHLTDQHTSARERHLFPKSYPFEPLSFPNVFRAVSIQFDAESEPPQERENPAFCQGQEQEEAQGKPQVTHPQKQWVEPAGDHREDQRDPARLVWLLPACEPGGAWRNRRMDAGKTAFDHQETARWRRPGTWPGPPALGQPLLCRAGPLLPRRSPRLGTRQSPVWSKVPTGEPDAVIPQVRFGRGSGSNPLLPHPRNATPQASLWRGTTRDENGMPGDGRGGRRGKRWRSHECTAEERRKKNLVRRKFLISAFLGTGAMVGCAIDYYGHR